MNVLPITNTGAGATTDIGSSLRHRHRPSCKFSGGLVPSCLCPRCVVKNVAETVPIFDKDQTKVRLWKFKLTSTYSYIHTYACSFAAFIYCVWLTVCAQTRSDTTANEQIPTSSSEVTFGLSIQYLVKDVVKNQYSFTHTFWHALCLCDCKNLDVLAELTHVNFPAIHYDFTRGGYGNFDKFRPQEHAFVVKKHLPTGGETSSCVVMERIHTRRSRKLYVFKTVTKDKSLITHPVHGIISNEAFVLLGLLKTNLYPHRNIVQLFNCVTSDAIAGIPLHILQMEYCDGGDLWQLNTRCIKHGARIPRSLMTHIFTSLTSALAYLHHGLILTSSGIMEREIVPNTQHWSAILHNDIKPENILLRWSAGPSPRRYPDIVLSDFGIAGIEGRVRGPQGTYLYSAPEVKDAFDMKNTLVYRLKFKAADIINAKVICTTKSDIWSLGAVMQYLLFEYDRVDGRRTRVCSPLQLADWAGIEEVYGEKLVSWTRRCLGATPLGRPAAWQLLGTAVREIKVGNRAKFGHGVQRLPAWIWKLED